VKIPHWLPEDKRPERLNPDAGKPKIEKVIEPITHYLHVEATGGLVLMACLVVALVVANSPWAGPYHEFWQTRIGFTVGNYTLNKPILLWINDGLMTVFFFLVGLEIKREWVFGELRDPRTAALPVAAALGGMVVPAGLYLALQGGQPGSRGWGVPMATDIAFVVGILALLGKRVPTGMKLLLLTLAIIDDIGAVIVIAVAYTADLAPVYFLPAAAGFGVTYLFNRIGVRPIPIYVALGAGIWLAFLKSGVHPTVAGVLLGLLTPAYSWFSGHSLTKVAEGVSQQLQHERDPVEHKTLQKEAALLLSKTAKETISPLARLETALHPWVVYTIMPLFALANAGVAIDLTALGNPVAIAVAVGLAVGKPIGIVLFSLAAVKFGLARLPTGVNGKSLIGAGCLAGIGFTMSLFIAGLALEGDLLTAGKVGTLTGSLISAALGMTILFFTLGKPKK
jgi:NhaA family Na+:H+ antiporter